MHLELITNFSVNPSFEVAYKNSAKTQIANEVSVWWRVLSYEDLITSKIKSNRPKDLLDIQELHRIRNK